MASDLIDRMVDAHHAAMGAAWTKGERALAHKVMRAALDVVLDEMREPTSMTMAYGFSIPKGHEPNRDSWKAMVAQFRKEHLGDR